MKIICYNCNKEFDRLNNIYGTFCPYCDTFIEAIEKPEFIIQQELKKKELQKQVLKKFRKNNNKEK